MKKVFQKSMALTALVSVFQMAFVTTLNAVPVVGKPGQGFAVYVPSTGGVDCTLGWHWCKTEYSSLATPATASFDIDNGGTISITCPIDFTKITFPKMFANKRCKFSYPVQLDAKISAALAPQLKLAKGTQLFLAKGDYSYDVSGKNIVIRVVKVGDMKNIAKAF